MTSLNKLFSLEIKAPLFVNKLTMQGISSGLFFLNYTVDKFDKKSNCNLTVLRKADIQGEGYDHRFLNLHNALFYLAHQELILIKTWLLTIIIYLLSLTILSGQELISWTGTGNGAWTSAANWNPPQVPTASDTVEIGNLNTVNYTATSQTISKLILAANGTLVINHPDARLNIINSATEGIKLTLKGHLRIESGTIFIQDTQGDGINLHDRSTIINRGNLLIGSYAKNGLSISKDSRFDNYGVLNIDQLNQTTALNGILALDGEFQNHSTGELFVSTCLTFLKPTLEVADGFILIDEGQSFFWKRNCN